MFRHCVAAAVLLAAFGCAAPSSSEPGVVMSGPEVQAATAACEPKYASHALTSLAQLAECERDLALPQEQQQQPWLADMFSGLWRDKVELYAKVDRGELTKPEADRKIAIEADNWLTNIRSARRV
jgi:hypothetical protein